MTEKLAFKFYLIKINLNLTCHVTPVAIVLYRQHGCKKKISKKLGNDFFYFLAFMLLPFLTWDGSLRLEIMAK